MLRKNRCDGTLLKDLHHFVRMLPYLMRTRTESAIYFEQDFDVTESLRILKSFNKNLDPSLQKVTFFQLFLCAAVRTFAFRPKLNRFISGKNYYQRNEIVFSFVAKKQLTEEGEEITLKLPLSPRETLASLSEKASALIRQSTSEIGNDLDDANALIMKMPRLLINLFFAAYRLLDYHNIAPSSLIRVDPFYASAFFTNLGSLGIDSPFHHNFEWGTCGLFISLGKIRKEWKPDRKGVLRQRDVVKVTFTFDDRVVDGIYTGRSVDMFRSLVENPEALFEEPVLNENLMGELMLKDYPVKAC